MAIVKSFAVRDINGQQGDVFYIKHSSSNFTIIDCRITDDNKNKENLENGFYLGTLVL